MPKKQIVPASVLEWVKLYKDDFGFHPQRTGAPTKLEPGSKAKVDLLANRVKLGQPVFQVGDKTEFPWTYKYVQRPIAAKVLGDRISGCEVSDDERYLYRLWRYWGDASERKNPVACFIRLNPRRIDWWRKDPEVSRMQEIAMHLECRGMEVVSLFGLRVDDPYELVDDDDPIGDGNDRAIRLTVKSSSFTICCWGEGGALYDRSARVLWALCNSVSTYSIYCVGLTKRRQNEQGQVRCQPKQVLRSMGRDVVPIPWGIIEHRLGESKEFEREVDW